MKPKKTGAGQSDIQESAVMHGCYDNTGIVSSPNSSSEKLGSKEFGTLTLTVEHNYIYYYITGVYNNNNMFWPYMWAIIRLWLDLVLRLY